MTLTLKISLKTEEADNKFKSLCVCVRDGGCMNGRRLNEEEGAMEGRGMWIVECPYLVFGLAGPMSAECFQPHCLQSTGTCQCVPLLERRC